MPPHVSVHPYTLSHTFSPLTCVCTVLSDVCDEEEEEEREEENESDLEGMAKGAS